MAINVEKKDGKKEKFERKKVVDSCVSCGAPRDVAAQIGDEVEKAVSDGVTTKEIRKMVLQKLGDIRQEWVKDWKEYEAKKK